MQAVLEELSLLFKAFSGWFWAFVFLTIFLFTFGFQYVEVWGGEMPVPSLAVPALSVKIFDVLKEDLLPTRVSLISLSPFAGFVTQTSVALLSAFILTLPILCERLLAYLLPALREEERNILWLVLIPPFILFFAGVAFAYYLVIPPTFEILYAFAPALGAQPFFTVDDFLSTVVLLMLSVGLMFLLPALMVMLAWLGLIPSRFWRVCWRHALLVFLVFAALVTPDGSGITMAILTLPMGILYIAAISVARRVEAVVPSGEKRGGGRGR